jgi:transcriptional regulator with XRE-family HTH domain
MGELACALYPCSFQNTLRLIVRLRSDIMPEDIDIQKTIKNWVLEKIIAQDKEALSSPLLNCEQWLDSLPPHKQAGSLLTEIIENKKVPRKEICRLLKISQPCLSEWESGDNPITCSKLGALINMLDITPEITEKLMSRILREITTTSRTQVQKATTVMGTTTRADQSRKSFRSINEQEITKTIR